MAASFAAARRGGAVRAKCSVDFAARPIGGQMVSDRATVSDMDTAARDIQFLDADAFLRTDQSMCGDAWRYELVRGTIVAHAAPSPKHGVILGNLAYEFWGRLRGHLECRIEVGSGAAPKCEQRDIARIPDATIRCGKLPRVLFETVSPSELQHKRQWDRKCADLQAVEGEEEIVEIFQDELLAHVSRRQAAHWVFELISGIDATMTLPSVGITLPLAALYERVMPEES